MARVLYMTFAILVALGGLAFHVRNDQTITLDYYLGSVDVALSWVVVGALVVGVLLGVLGMASSWLRMRSELRRSARRREQAEREAASLRALALKDVG